MFFQQFSSELKGRRAGTVKGLFRIILGKLDQLFYGLYGRIFGNRNNEGEIGHHRDGLEIILGVVGQVLVDRRINHDWPTSCNHEGIAIWLSPSSNLRTYNGCHARTV